MNYKFLEWDSSFFGYNVACVYNEKLKEQELADILKHLANKEVKLVYLFLSPKSHLNHLATLHKGLLVDKKVVFKKSLNNNKQLLNSYDQVRVESYKKVTLNNKLLELAFLSGEYSRFKKDPGFGNNEFERLYTEWIVRSIKGEIASIIFVAYYINEIIGFVTLSLENNLGRIGLIAVDKEFRKMGIAHELLKKCEEYLIEKNIFNIEVSTQMDNEAAVNLYYKKGFVLESITHIYHIWL